MVATHVSVQSFDISSDNPQYFACNLEVYVLFKYEAYYDYPVLLLSSLLHTNAAATAYTVDTNKHANTRKRSSRKHLQLLAAIAS